MSDHINGLEKATYFGESRDDYVTSESEGDDDTSLEGSDYGDNSRSNFEDPTLDLAREEQIEARNAMLARLVVWQWPPQRNTRCHEDISSNPSLQVSQLLASMCQMTFWYDDASEVIYYGLDREIQQEYESRAAADKIRCQIETEDFNMSMPLASMPSFNGIPPPHIRRGTWLDINGVAPEKTRAASALLWNRYRRDYQAFKERSPETAGSSCYFTSVPLEIRNQIYRWLLAYPNPIRCFRNRRLAMAHPQPLDPRILAVNHTIHQEALSVFYEVHTLKPKCRAWATSGFPKYSAPFSGHPMAVLRYRIKFLYVIFELEPRKDWAELQEQGRRLCRVLLGYSNLQEIRVGFIREGGRSPLPTDEDAKDFCEQMLSCLDPLKEYGKIHFIS